MIVQNTQNTFAPGGTTTSDLIMVFYPFFKVSSSLEKFRFLINKIRVVIIVFDECGFI